MDDTPIAELSFDRIPNALGHADGYDLWFDLPPKNGDATTSELQTLCQGSILLGRIAEDMNWNWTDLVAQIDHLSAPLDGFLLVEVGRAVFRSERFRRALHDAIPASGLDPYKVKIIDTENANVYILGHGLPSL